MVSRQRSDAGADRTHVRIATVAVERGYLTLADAAEALLEAGASGADPRTAWLQGGWLDEVQYAEVSRRVAMSGGDRQTPTGSLAIAQAAISDEHDEVAVDSDAAEAMTLADVMKTIAFDDSVHLEPTDDDSGEVDTVDAVDRTVIARSGLPTSEGTARYILGGELGRGGVGRVMKAFDRDLGRTVAMKVPLGDLQNPEIIEKFIEEAQATGQLEHPNIVPVYDVGVLASGEVYYTMKRVPHHSLRDVLFGLIQGDPELTEQYTLTRLISIFLQVCQAVHYAHVRGVIHRDLKPENIMLGSYGEVHVTDWGLARVMDRHVVTSRSLRGGDRTESGQTVGTPAYMPPEQARGYLHIVDERSDVYSLGVILYEITTLVQPSTRPTVMETLMAVISEDVQPPSLAAPDREVPEALEDVILKAMAKERDQRFTSAKELHDAIERYLDGRNDKEAERRVQRGDHYVSLYMQAKHELAEIDEAVLQMESRIKAWDAVEVKRSLWALEDKRRDTANRMIRMFGEAMREFQQALAHVPGHEWATSGIAELVWSRYKLAETTGNHLDQLYYESVLSQYDDGTYMGRLYGRTQLTVFSSPPGASVFLYAYEEVDRSLVLGKPEYLGETPTAPISLSRGSYQLRVKHPEHPAVNLPLHITSAAPMTARVRLIPESYYADGFVYVPPGEAIIGGDPLAFAPLPQQKIYVGGFFIQRYPVTFRQYLAFLDDLQRTDPEMAFERTPRTRDADGLLALLSDDGRFYPSPILIEGEMRQIYPEDEGHEWDIPVVAVRRQDIQHYAAWLSERDGVRYRLPDEIEWERAARGADGRAYPWGDHFDSTFCKMTSSRSVHNQPEPVGAFPGDCSPFEVFDLAGGVREIVDSAGNQVIYRGGSWGDDARICRAASRGHMLAQQKAAVTGFRLAYDAPAFADEYDETFDETGEFERIDEHDDIIEDESFPGDDESLEIPGRDITKPR